MQPLSQSFVYDPQHAEIDVNLQYRFMLFRSQALCKFRDIESKLDDYYGAQVWRNDSLILQQFKQQIRLVAEKIHAAMLRSTLNFRKTSGNDELSEVMLEYVEEAMAELDRYIYKYLDHF